LYTKDDTLCIVLENEQECESWLLSLLTLQHGEEILDGQEPKPDYGEFYAVFWIVTATLFRYCMDGFSMDHLTMFMFCFFKSILPRSYLN